MAPGLTLGPASIKTTEKVLEPCLAAPESPHPAFPPHPLSHSPALETVTNRLLHAHPQAAKEIYSCANCRDGFRDARPMAKQGSLPSPSPASAG